MVFAKPFGRTRQLYFIGIGGIGMSALAKIVFAMGYKVAGSDLKASETTAELSAMGVTVVIGHHRKHIQTQQNIDVVITSSAISPGNVELLAAQDRGIPIITRGELLAEIMRLKEGIAIAGTHGKTTTTAMVSAIFHQAGFSPTSVIGGRWSGIHSNAQLGKSEILICETDESDGSFLKLSPVLAVVTNIDLDHMDYYQTEERLLLHFLEFMNSVPFYGKTFLCLDSPRLAGLCLELKKPYASYGIMESSPGRPRPDFHAVIKTLAQQCSIFNVTAYGRSLGTFTLNMPGEHNVQNALAAIGVALEAGIAINDIQLALKHFKGVERRLSVIGKWRGLTLMDDYGHHPTELNATLKTVKRFAQRLIVVFQPHRYTRTLEHYKAFARELAAYADKIYLAPIYSAGEAPIENVSSELIARELRHLMPQQAVTVCAELEDLRKTIIAQEQGNNGILITIGAGNIYTVAKTLSQTTD